MTLEKITRVALEREIVLYKSGAGIYSGKDKQKLNLDDKRKLFAQQVAEIILNKFNKYYTVRGSHERDQDSGLLCWGSRWIFKHNLLH